MRNAAHRPPDSRQKCPICGPDRGPGDRTLEVWREPGGVFTAYCHRGCDWQAIKTALGENWEPPPRERGGPRPAGDPNLRDRLWHLAKPLSGTCPASLYLLDRGCALPPPGGDLRFLPAHGDRPAALVALVTDARTGAPLTLHLTRLGPCDGPRKRLLTGLPKRGGVIRLWPDDHVSMGLGIAEGTESALSAALGFAPVWAAVDAGNVAAFPVLPGIECLTVFADGDRAGRQAADACAARWHAAGRDVRLVDPGDGLDLNDLVREVGL